MSPQFPIISPSKFHECSHKRVKTMFPSRNNYGRLAKEPGLPYKCNEWLFNKIGIGNIDTGNIGISKVLA